MRLRDNKVHGPPPTSIPYSPQMVSASSPSNPPQMTVPQTNVSFNPPNLYNQGVSAQSPVPDLFEDTSMQNPVTNYPTSTPFQTQNFYNQQQYQAPQQPASVAPSQPQPALYDPTAMMNFNQPMAGVAMQYGKNFVDQGQAVVSEKVQDYIASSNVKYYFAVDTQYVIKKILLLFFPFFQKNWSVKYCDKDNAIPPRNDINAPDLYIPSMAFATFILAASVALGIQNRFTPEQFSMETSTTLVWLLLEVGVLWMTKYIMSIATKLKLLDLFAFSGYKYPGMIFTVLSGLLFGKYFYYGVLLWTSFSFSFFLIRTLKVKIESGDFSASDEVHQPTTYYDYGGTGGGQSLMNQSHAGMKRRLYLLLFMAAIQPLLMWWLTRDLTTSKPMINTSQFFGSG